MGRCFHTYVPVHLLDRIFAYLGTATAILVGLLLMMWPALAKVRWEHFMDLFRGRQFLASCVPT